MKATRKLIPALALLLVSAMMLGTASFAWFASNTTVTASGMSVKAVAPENLFIKSAKTGAAWGVATSDAWGNAYALNATRCENDVWQTATGISASDGTALGGTYTDLTIAEYTDTATGAVYGYVDDGDGAFDGTKDKVYYVKMTYSFYSNDELNRGLKITAITWPTATENFFKAMTMMVKAGDVTVEVANDAAAPADTLITAISHDQNAPSTVDVYLFFDGDNENCTSLNFLPDELAGLTITFGFAS